MSEKKCQSLFIYLKEYGIMILVLEGEFMEKHELSKLLEDFNRRINSLEVSLNVNKLKKEYNDLLLLQSAEGFWNNVGEAQKVIKEASQINAKIEGFLSLKESYDAASELFQIVDEFAEDDYLTLVEEVKRIAEELDSFEILVLLSGKYDGNNCIFELQAGAGGTESMDWCMMLYRMYLRYFTKKGYTYQLLDIQHGEEAGLKSVSMLVKGDMAYGYLKAEDGVHRLVRISPFDSNKRRHTSFVACLVIPEIEDGGDIEINDEDIRVDVFRSGGAGGQSVNTTDSAVRITHLPTNIVVTCQNERSQIKNREVALNVLKSRLIQLQEKEKSEELASLKGELKAIAWGSQIRSYVFHPYQMVKDHRTNYETSQTDDVMDGDLDAFIDAYLRQVGHDK